MALIEERDETNFVHLIPQNAMSNISKAHCDDLVLHLWAIFVSNLATRSDSES
jgi:hypothetical protein